MLIWLLAIVLIGAVTGMGWRQGGIRAAFSFVGIIIGALLCVPIGHLLGKLLGVVGIKDPLLVWALGPIVAFIIISALFKVGAFYAHQKVDVWFKYKGGDLRLALWERLNARVGICVGILNGVAYAILLSFVLYVPSYAAVQVESSDGDPSWLRFLANLGRGLHSSGMDKVARSIDSMPEINYRMVDLAATLYRNPLAEARLASYPGFLSISELPAFADLSVDKNFVDPWQRQVPIMELMGTVRVQGVRNNPEVMRTLWDTTETDLNDLREYLKTGRSPKYDPIKILGRWRFDVGAAVGAIRRSKPAMSSRDMQAWRAYIGGLFGKASLTARPDHSVSVKNTPGLKLPTALAGGAPPGLQTINGQWKDLDSSKYLLSFSGNDLPGTAQGDRLTIKSEGVDLVFNRED